MPKVGMRMIKSAVAVFLCFFIGMLRGDGIPFYSAIAAILCMQPYVQGSIKVAVNRVIGTLIGGIAGMLVLVFLRQCVSADMQVLRYGIISFCILPLIYIPVALHWESAAYITCVVFLSVTVSHGGESSPFSFALSRIFDTLIGIAVSLGVNMFHIPRPKNLSVLFVCELDYALMNLEGKISKFSKVKLNQMKARGASLSIVTVRTPATLLDLLDGLNLDLPVAVMDGAALFDLKTKTYLDCRCMDHETSKEIMRVFSEIGKNCFAHVIINDVLHVFYQGEFNCPMEKRYYDSMKMLSHKHYIFSTLPSGRQAIYFKALDTLEEVKKMKQALQRSSCAKKIRVSFYSDPSYPGHYFLQVHSALASKGRAALDLKEKAGAKRMVAFCSSQSDRSLIEVADEAYAVENAAQSVKDSCSGVIGPCEKDSVAKAVEKLFYHKNLR